MKRDSTFLNLVDIPSQYTFPEFIRQHFKANTNDNGCVVGIVPDPKQLDYFKKNALTLARRRKDIVKDLQDCKNEDFLYYLVEKYKNEKIFTREPLFSLIIHSEIYAYAYRQTQDLTVYTNSYHVLEQLHLTRELFEEKELLKIVMTTRDLRLNLAMLYVENRVIEVEWGYVVMNAVRKYIYHEDRFYIDTCVESDRVLQCLDTILTKPMLNDHPPIANISLTNKPIMNKPTLVKMLSIPDPSFATIKVSKIFNMSLSGVPSVSEWANGDDTTTLFVLLKKYTKLDKRYTVHRGEEKAIQKSDYQSFTNIVIVFNTKREQEMWRHATHPLIPKITRLQAYLLHIANLAGDLHGYYRTRRAFFYRNDYDC